ncbi:helix-turn-helix domain-containing protein [Bradyrhizobium lablabi]|uniref:winged helix-turn-helix transcriptional regulator n=1 Tax=Bradyrhizobium lablabi TaxID=722472 RepID=UPI001BA521CF|nr:helix-turn-helix domain-containing protein [Bradyrhizobium lablabi]MBR0692596.1 helix-turn-helix transcriptional regulator [Bradyrhizobium lablabi]
MKRYGQFCPVAKAAEVFCQRWTPLILRDLALGASRFSELQRGVPLASPSLLSHRLRQLENEGIVERSKSASGHSWTYHLTSAGDDLVPIVMALGVWGQKWSRRELAKHEIDLGLLLWALERGARPDAFGDRRTVVQLALTDQIAKKRYWWFLNEDGRCELCLSKPDHRIDLFLEGTLRDLVCVWRGDLLLAQALDTGRLRAHGTVKAQRALPRWLAISTIAHVQSARADVGAV